MGSNKLSTQNNNSALALTKLSKPLLATLSEDYPKIRDIKDTKQTDSLLNYLITLLNLKCSNETEEKDLNIQMLVVMDFIKNRFGSLTIEEIKEAFKMYVAKEFIEIKVFRMLDSVCAGEVLNAYINFRNESLRIFSSKRSFLLNAPTVPTDEQKTEIRENYLKLLFNELKEGNRINVHKDFYDELDYKGKFTISSEEKREMYALELKKYIPIKTEELRKNVSARLLIDQFKLEIEENQPIEQVKIICRNNVVTDYLSKYLTDFETFKKAIE